MASAVVVVTARSAAPIAHHRKNEEKEDASRRPSPAPAPNTVSAPIPGLFPADWRRRSRLVQIPPYITATPDSSGNRATASTLVRACPGLIGTRTGPSRCAGSASSESASNTATMLKAIQARLLMARAPSYSQVCRDRPVPEGVAGTTACRGARAASPAPAPVFQSRRQQTRRCDVPAR